jgi:hypothetical protein
VNRDQRLTRASAVLLAINGAGFAVTLPPILASIARNGELPTAFGIRLLGGGPFEALGTQRVVQLGWAYFAVSLGQLGAAALLWRYRRAGAVASLVLLPAEVAGWIGFALPFPPPPAALRLALLVAGRRALR